MFDNKQNLDTSSQGGQVPPNLPTSEPVDILSDVESSTPESGPISRPAFSDSTVNLGPKYSEAPQMMSSQPSASKEPSFNGKRKIVVALIVIIILLILGIAVWYGYQVFSKAPVTPAVNNNNVPVVNTNNSQPVANQNSNINSNSNQGSDVDTNTNVDNEVVPSAPPTDTDRDGLTDEEETLYGTNPNVVDSDQDGLTDRDEVKVFETDPNNSDSDGDGFTDGNEVRAGYDPKGDGKLLEIN